MSSRGVNITRISIENEEGTFIETREFQKISQVSDKILCGMTGDAEWGISLARELTKYQDMPASQLIKIIENFNKSFKVHSTFVLVGKYDDGKLFYYGFKTENKKGGINFDTNELMATSPMEYLNKCSNFYLDLKDDGYSNIHCAIQTIRFASLQNPKYISEEYDHIQIKL